MINLQLAEEYCSSDVLAAVMQFSHLALEIVEVGLRISSSLILMGKKVTVHLHEFLTRSILGMECPSDLLKAME